MHIIYFTANRYFDMVNNFHSLIYILIFTHYRKKDKIEYLELHWHCTCLVKEVVQNCHLMIYFSKWNKC